MSSQGLQVNTTDEGIRTMSIQLNLGGPVNGDCADVGLAALPFLSDLFLLLFVSLRTAIGLARGEAIGLARGGAVAVSGCISGTSSRTSRLLFLGEGVRSRLSGALGLPRRKNRKTPRFGGRCAPCSVPRVASILAILVVVDCCKLFEILLVL